MRTKSSANSLSEGFECSRSESVSHLRISSCRIAILLFFLFPLLLSAAPKKDTLPIVETSVVHDTTVKVLRGGTCEITLRAISSHGYDVKFEITSRPRSGSLSAPQRNSKSSVSYFYTHDGKKNIASDSFRFKGKTGPGKAWAYAKATILVQEPNPRFEADVSVLDFGPVFIGESRTRSVRIKNAGGGRLQGILKVPEPWIINDSSDLSLAEGEVKTILVTFTPLSTDTQRGNLVLESGKKPFPEVALEGVGESRFEVPEKIAFEQRTGADQLSIPVKNRTAAPLSVSVHCPQPLVAPASLEIPPESSGELVLTLPARPFEEKSALVTLNDGAATLDIRVQLPPPPSRLEWLIEGENQLGKVTPGRTIPLSAQLVNTGGNTADVTLRAEGAGLVIDPAQAARFTIPPGDKIPIRALWTFQETPGESQASLIAETKGLPPLSIPWYAEVQLPESPAAPPVGPWGSTPSPTPRPDKEIIKKYAASELPKRLATGITRVLAAPDNALTLPVILNWQYSGPEPVKFVVVKPAKRPIKFLDKNPFEKSIPLPDEVPKPPPVPLWDIIDSKNAIVTKISDGHWQARITDLDPGWHSIGIITEPSGVPESKYGLSELSVFVGETAGGGLLRWFFYAILAICTSYLLRNKFRDLFRF